MPTVNCSQTAVSTIEVAGVIVSRVPGTAQVKVKLDDGQEIQAVVTRRAMGCLNVIREGDRVCVQIVRPSKMHRIVSIEQVTSEINGRSYSQLAK